jgi:hypothetical protein
VFRSFRAVGWKNLRVEGVELGRVNLLVGPNNCGKTNLIEALGLAGRLAAHPKRVAEGVRAALVDLLSTDVADRRRKERAPVEMAWGWTVPEEASLQLVFDVGPPDRWPGGLRVIEAGAELGEYGVMGWQAERVVPGAAGGVMNSGDIRVAGRNQILFSAAVPLTAVHFPRLSRADITQPRKADDSDLHLSSDASTLANHLRALELSPEGLEPLVERLRDALPRLERLWVGEGGGYRWVQVRMGGATYSLSELSDGTLTMIVLGTLLFGSAPAPLLAVDEPELSVHPAWLKVAGRWLQRFTSPGQVLVSTHAPDLLDTFTEGFRAGDVKLLVFDAEGGLRNVEPSALEARLAEGWELGDLYRVGDPALGGWPW